MLASCGSAYGSSDADRTVCGTEDQLVSGSVGSVVWGSSQEAWFEAVNHLSRLTPWLHGPARVYTEYGAGLFAGVLLLSWWWARRDGDLRRVAVALWAPVGALVAVGVNQLLSTAVAEPRPYTALSGVSVLVSRTSDYSFPSDHAVMAGAVTAGVLLAHRRLGLVTAALAVLMAFSRVYVGAHFPLDVVAGLLVGSVVAVATYVVARPFLVWLVRLLARTRVRALLLAPSPGVV